MLSPRTLRPSRKITPAPRKPIPETRLCRYPSWTGIAGDKSGENHKSRRSQGDQRVGAQAGDAIAPLAFEADDGAEATSHREIERGLFCRNCH